MRGHNVIPILSKERRLADVRLLSNEARDWKFHVVSEAEHVLVVESTEAPQRARLRIKNMDQHY